MDSEALLKGMQQTQNQMAERYFQMDIRSRKGAQIFVSRRHISEKKQEAKLKKQADIELSCPQKMRLKLFVNESTFSERVRFYFIKNQTTSLRIRLFKLSVKIAAVILYLVRAGLEKPYEVNCCGLCTQNNTEIDSSKANPTYNNQYEFLSHFVFWVNRPAPIWYLQVTMALISFSLEIVNTYAQYKGNLCQQLFSVAWFFEFFLCSGPFIATLCWSPLRCLFVPSFLNVWLAKAGLESIINDLHRAAHKQQSAMFNQVSLLLSTLLCLLITCVCGVQHLERAGEYHMDLFNAVWFSVVTFSTVGYGDITPTIWPSKLLVVIIIIAAFVIIPSQVEQISILYSERQRLGGEYSRQRAKTEKHVVVCSTVLRMDVILDFLNEFYAHPVLQNYYVVLLSPMELHGPLKSFLQIPIWAERVIYIQGSVLRDIDLDRVKMDVAKACFMLTSRQEVDRIAADEKTILRAMAVKDYAPGCPLYVQILRPESMLHVQFADKVICDEEFKYLLLAMNSYIPAISTLITLLAHTSKGQEGESLGSNWKKEFGRSAGNEIYSVIANDSKFFHDFIGYKFCIASMLAHSKYGATLFAVERSGEIRINPGNEFNIDPDDTLFYICLTQEEDAAIVEDRNKKRLKSKSQASFTSATEPIKSAASFDRDAKMQDDVFENDSNSATPLAVENPLSNTIIKRTKIGFPPISPYVGYNTPIMCHILEEKSPLCCLRLDRPCEHCRNTSAFDYNWPNPPIIVSAEFAPQSLFNIMLPLRAHYKTKSSLHPIILLLEHSPENNFLNAISFFPMVYYLLGGMDGLDPLLKAGVKRAQSMIIMDRESSMYAEEEYMADARQLVATQTVFRLFPTLPTCLELTHSSNMKFMHFHAVDKASLNHSEYRKSREKEKSCSMPYLFRKSFASGKVFSASMLDTLLYQSFVKDYLTTLLRILLGLQYTPGSGHLSTYQVKQNEEGKTYQELFRSMSRKYGYVVLGVYRFEDKEQSPELSSSKVNSPMTEKFNQFAKEKNTNGEGVKNTRSYSIGDELFMFGSLTKRRVSSMSLSTMRKTMKLKFSSNKRLQIRRLQLMESTKTEREKLDEMIQGHMQELELTDKAFGSPSKSKDCVDRFGYILLNPSGDLELQSDDILYIIKPEISVAESRPTSCMSDPVECSPSFEEFGEKRSASEEHLNNNNYGNGSKLANKRHTTICVISEEDPSNISRANSPVSKSETTGV